MGAKLAVSEGFLLIFTILFEDNKAGLKVACPLA